MKKTIYLFSAALIAALSAAWQTGSIQAAGAQEVLSEAMTEDLTEGSAPLQVQAEIDWSVFLPEDPETYVTLGDYHGLEVTRSVYTITDEDAQIEIDDRLSMQAVVEETDRSPQTGDLLTLDLTVTTQEEPYTEKDFAFDQGYEYFGPEFDKQMEQMKPGEEKTFSIRFGEDAQFPDWADQEVEFTVLLKKVETTITPELTDDWVRDNSDFDNTEDYMASVKEELQKQYDRSIDLDTGRSALALAVEASDILDYPQDMLDAAREQNVSQYKMMADMFGISLDELYENYDVTEDDLEDQAEEMVARYLVVSAIARAENITAEETDLQSYAEENYEAFGYEDSEAMLQEADQEELQVLVLEEKVCAFLLTQANVTLEEDALEEEALSEDDSSAIDIELLDDEELDTWEDDSEGGIAQLDMDASGLVSDAD